MGQNGRIFNQLDLHEGINVCYCISEQFLPILFLLNGKNRECIIHQYNEGVHLNLSDTLRIDRFNLTCKLLISMFMCTFDTCGFLLENNIICGNNETSSDNNIMVNLNIHLSKVSKVKTLKLVICIRG